jgi:NADH:ubiquinone reductase (non-electrogenic)
MFISNPTCRNLGMHIEIKSPCLQHGHSLTPAPRRNKTQYPPRYIPTRATPGPEPSTEKTTTTKIDVSDSKTPTTPPGSKSTTINNSSPISTTSKPQTSKYPLQLRRSWTSIFADQVIDSIDDIFTHAKRYVTSLPTTTALQRLTRREGGKLVLKSDKPVVLVLGSGWGAHSLLKVIDTDKYEVVAVSPTNAFLFTPMLPSCAVGTVEFRSLLEPIRIANEYVTYCEAKCSGVDLQAKIAKCTSVIADGSGKKREFEVPYSTLVVSVGEQPASFGVPGVKDHCFFMKEVTDAVRLRKRIQEVFELAALPGTSPEEARKSLHFIVVGGGPTGVEFAGTLSDFVREDLKRKYPELMQYVKVSLLQSAQTILMQFDAQLAARAMTNFKNIGVDVRTGVRVTEVTAEHLVLGTGEIIDYGVCVWSAGNAPRQLTLDIATAIPQQMDYAGPNGKVNKLAVDPFLRVIGARDVLALGDCNNYVAGSLPATAQVAAQQGAYAAHMVNRGYRLGVGGVDMLPPWKPAADLSLADRVFGRITDSISTSIDDSEDLINSTDLDGNNLHSINNNVKNTEIVMLTKPFEFLSLGILASIGNDKAVAQIEAFDSKVPVWGNPAFWLWKSVYITKQVSFRNRVLILVDWAKTRVFGRDLSQF